METVSGGDIIANVGWDTIVAVLLAIVIGNTSANVGCDAVSIMVIESDHYHSEMKKKSGGPSSKKIICITSEDSVICEVGLSSLGNCAIANVGDNSMAEGLDAAVELGRAIGGGQLRRRLRRY